MNAIDKRVERGTLERAIAARAKARAKELVSGAITDADFANGKYKEDMTPDALIAAVTKEIKSKEVPPCHTRKFPLKKKLYSSYRKI